MDKKTTGAPRTTTGEKRQRYRWESSAAGDVKKILSPEEAAEQERWYGAIEDAICQFLGGPVRWEILDHLVATIEGAGEFFGPLLFDPEEKGGEE